MITARLSRHSTTDKFLSFEKSTRRRLLGLRGNNNRGENIKRQRDLCAAVDHLKMNGRRRGAPTGQRTWPVSSYERAAIGNRRNRFPSLSNLMSERRGGARGGVFRPERPIAAPFRVNLLPTCPSSDTLRYGDDEPVPNSL